MSGITAPSLRIGFDITRTRAVLRTVAERRTDLARLVGRYSEALFHANKALQGLKHGTPMALRMEDVRAQAEQHQDSKQQRN